MARNFAQNEKNKINLHPDVSSNPVKKETFASESDHPLVELQRQVGNRAVQRLIIQRSGQGPAELDKDTEERIEHDRLSGSPLDSHIQNKMEQTTGQNLEGVQIHTSEESDQVNRQLGARAFTTGNDIFFSNGTYQPDSAEGQKLIAHELAHVVQQRGVTGSEGSERMTVNAPHDRFEQEADTVAQSVMNRGTSPEIQRQSPEEEEEEKIQRQEEDEEDLRKRKVGVEDDVEDLVQDKNKKEDDEEEKL